nr:peptidyl-prolyl cis-trans isomerase B-like isoform X2 [Procambarus clarkii]
MATRLPNVSLLKVFMIVISIPITVVSLYVVGTHLMKESREFKVTEEVYFEVSQDGRRLGEMVFGLFGEVVPRTVANFVAFATKGYKGYSYRGSVFHRVIKNFMVQGGDVVSGDGKGSISIYGTTFPDENFIVKHGAPGFLSMSNKGKDSNGCQFFITTISTPWLNTQHVVFGKLVEGEPVLEEVQSVATDWNDRPLRDVVITNSGRRVVKEPYLITDDPFNIKGWILTSSPPLLMSFSIILIYHYLMKRLDEFIIEDDGSMDDEETKARKKRKREEEEERKLMLEQEKGEQKKGEEERNADKDGHMKERNDQGKRDMGVRRREGKTGEE